MVGRRPLRRVDVTKKSAPLDEYTRHILVGSTLTVIGRLDVVLVFDEIHAVDGLLVGQRRIA